MMWTQSEEITLRELWEQGIRLRTIADMMGKTPGSIAGKVDRLSLSPRDRKEFALRGEQCPWWKGGRKRYRVARGQARHWTVVRRVKLAQEPDAQHGNPRQKIAKPGRLSRFVLGY